MKNFFKQNWYKLMVGSSLMMASFGFLILAISPAYSGNYENSGRNQSNQFTNSNTSANGVIVGDYVYFVDGGYVYQWDKTYSWNSISTRAWIKHKLPE